MAVLGYKIAPNRFRTTYRSVLTFEEKKQSITRLFKTFSGLRLGCNAFVMRCKRSENTVNWTFQNQRHFKCEDSARAEQWRHKQASNQTWKSGLCVWVSTEQPTWKKKSGSNLQGWSSFSVVGTLFISPLLFHLSRALLGAWRFGLFRCVYSSFHNRLDLLREPALYWVFYFPNLALFVSSYVMMKKVFSLGLPFCFSSYIAHLRCTNEGGCLDVERTAHSFLCVG